MLRFMQIYGNCTAVHILGKDRIKGPVDNVVTKGVDCLKTLLDGDYLTHMESHDPIVTPRVPANPKDHPFLYEYPIVDVLHNDPRTEKSVANLKTRLDNFAEFKRKALTDADYYFVYSMNDYDLDKATHTIRLDRFAKNVECLRREGLLGKTIFVETRNYERPNSFWNFWAKNAADVAKRYGLKYVQVTGLIGGGEVDNSVTAVPEFRRKAEKAIAAKKNENQRTKRMRSDYCGERDCYLYF